MLRALDRNNGTVRWQKSLPMRPSTGPVLTGWTLLVAGNTAELRGYSSEFDGAELGDLVLKSAEDQETQLAALPHVTADATLVLITKGGQMQALIGSPAPYRPLNLMISTTLRRIYAGGLTCALVVAAVGFALERARFGASEAEASGARGAVDPVRYFLGRRGADGRRFVGGARARPLRRGRRESSRAPARASSSIATDQALQGRPPGEFAVSAYRPSGSGTPLAWSGRPSEIPLERLSEGEAFFVESVPLGIRLVYVKPVTDTATGHRLGMIAAERVLSASRGIQAPSAEATLSIPTVVPVTVRPHDASLAGLPHTFVIAAPDGAPSAGRPCHAGCVAGVARAMARERGRRSSW